MTVTAKIVCDGHGMGGFLDPPDYPTHRCWVASEIRRRPENWDGTSLHQAAEEEWLPESVRAEAAALLAFWHADPPPLDSEPVRSWVLQVLGYFKGCFRGPQSGDEAWHVANLSIEKDTDPVLNADIHAGVRLIRRFYPSFTPTAEDFAEARWGS